MKLSQLDKNTSVSKYQKDSSSVFWTWFLTDSDLLKAEVVNATLLLIRLHHPIATVLSTKRGI